MTVLTWKRQSKEGISAPKCECCRQRKVQWYPVLIGYPLLSSNRTWTLYGLCGVCRDEWDEIVANHGRAA